MPIYRGTGGSGDASTDAYASQVATYANTATTKANEASASASTASSAASTATTQAGIATSAASTASSAASTATTQASTATSAASTATTQAGLAQDSADAAAASAASAAAAITYENLNTNGDVGTGADQVAVGNHNHTGVYEPADATILKDADIGVTVQAYDATYVVDADIGVTVQGYDADTAKLDVAQTYTASQRGTVTTDNDLSFDMSASNFFKCTPTGTGTLTFTNITAGQSGNIWLDNSAAVVISAASTTYISAADLTKINSAGVYFLSYYSDGTNVLVSASSALTSAGA